MFDDLDRATGPSSRINRLGERMPSSPPPNEQVARRDTRPPLLTDAERVGAALRFSESMARRGQYREAVSTLSECLQRLGENADPTLRARLVGRTGILEARQGFHTAAMEHCRQAYAVLRETGEEETGLLELALGGLAAQQGRSGEAVDYYECALFTCRRTGRRDGIARALSELGLLLSRGSRWREARDHLTRALTLSEETGDLIQVADQCLNLGRLQTHTGDWVSAHQLLDRALSTYRGQGNEYGCAHAHLALGDLMLRRRQDHAAETNLAHALEIAQRHGYVRVMILGQLRLAGFQRRQASPARAKALLNAAQAALMRSEPGGDLLSDLRREQARTCLALGDTEEAVSLAAQAVICGQRAGDDAAVGVGLRVLGQSLMEMGQAGLAQRVLRRGAELLANTPEVPEWNLTRLEMARQLACAARTSLRGEEQRMVAVEASAIYEGVWPRFLELDLPIPAIDTLFALIGLRLASGDLEQAASAAARAAELVERVADPERRQKISALRALLDGRAAEARLAQSPEFQLLQDVASADPGDPPAMALSFLKALCRFSDSDRAVLAWGGGSGGVQIEASIGVAESEWPPMRRLLQRLLEDSGGSAKAHCIMAPHLDHRSTDLPTLIATTGVAAAIAVPLPDGLRGVLYVDRRPSGAGGAYRHAHLQQLTLLAASCSILLSGRAHRVPVREVGPPAAPPRSADGYGAFITCDPRMLAILDQVRRIAESESGVLITGETGTGKGLLTMLIHRSSRRAQGPFVPINCAALPESLLESELYGHLRGAFTGAVRDKVGLFEEARGGTLFLDEVDKTNLAVQAKLLHVLDRREIRPVGSNRWRPVDVRVMCATNTDLAAAIRAGHFLEDLYYRLNDFCIHIPPLRERRDDISLLIGHFLRIFAGEMGHPVPSVSRDAMRILTQAEWRGNVRELAKVVKRMVVLADAGAVIGADVLPPEYLERAARPSAGESRSLRTEVRSLEARLIQRTLKDTKGNKSEAARRLQMSYPSLLTKIRLYALDEMTTLDRDPS
jgi:DNA-binding NtrC family response regulator